MTVQYGGYLPLKRKHIRSHIPCESCGFRRSTVQVTLELGNSPGERVTHRLCDTCDPKNQ